MNPAKLRLLAFTILLVGSLGIVFFYLQILKAIYGEKETITQIQRNYVGQILDNLRRDVHTYIAESDDTLRFVSTLDASGLKANEGITVEQFEKNEIDGVLVLDGNNRVLEMKGVPIMADSFNVCLDAKEAVEGIHTCPVSGHTIMYSVVPRLEGLRNLYTVVFYKQVSSNLEKEIENVTNFPVRFLELEEPPINLPGFIHETSILKNFEEMPLIQMISYYHKSILDQARNILIFTVGLITLMGILAYITTSLSRVAVLARTLKHKNEQLTRVTNQRETLLHILSHDLNNYLTGIMGYAELAQSKKATHERIQSYVSAIMDAAKRQTHIIEMVRLQRALESGKLNVAVEPTELELIVQQLLVDFDLRLKEKNITVEVLAGMENIIIMVEPITFSVNVLNNVFSNAIKFSQPGGKILIGLKKSRKGMVDVFIADNGIGIPEDMLGDIWSERKKTTRRGTLGEKGTGFGMPLVKKFIEAYKGSVQIESNDISTHPNNHGTKVTLSLRTASGN